MYYLNRPPFRYFIAALLSLFIYSSPLNALPERLGDLDEDGSASVYDLTRLIAHYNGDLELSESLAPFADINRDGAIDQIDIQLLRDAVIEAYTLPTPVFKADLNDFPDATTDTLFEVAGVALPGASILIEGGVSPVTGSVGVDGTFSIDVTLREDQENRLFVTIFDTAGNASPPRAFHVTHDSSPPNLYVDFPPNNSELITETTDIAGRVGDLLSGYQGLDVKVNGVAAAVVVGIGQNGSFERSAVPLEIGKNVITVTAKDSLGNESTKNHTIYRIEPEGPIIETYSGNNQGGAVDETLALAATVRVRFPNGTPIANKLVNFKVIKSNGLLSSTNDAQGFAGAGLTQQVLTDSEGLAKIWWRMGHDAGCGNNRLQATSKDLDGIAYFCASAYPNTPSQINIGSGNNQRVAINSIAPLPLRVWVNDSCNGVPETPVIYKVISGNGKINGSDEAVAVTTRTGHAGIEFELGPNQGNNIVEADFEGNPGPPARFVVYGLETGAEEGTTWEGIIFDNANRPIGGAICKIVIAGVEYPPVLSNDDGTFEIKTLASGTGHLYVDGLVANKLDGEDIPEGSFPSLHYQVLVVEDATNSLGEPVLLPPLDPVNAQVFDNRNDIVLTCEGIDGLKMTIKADSMRLADGTKPDWRNPAIVSLNQVHHDDAPMPMPDGVSPPFAWTLQPSGATFDPPIQIEYPNMKGLAPGAVAYFLSYDHDLEEFVIVASGHVTDDGSTIVTDPEVGLTKAGWGCNCPPYSVTADCEKCKEKCRNPGTLTGGNIDVPNASVSAGGMVIFNIEPITHKGKSVLRICEDGTSQVISVPGGSPTIEWTITKPDGTKKSGSGYNASTPADLCGKYTFSYTATVSGDCSPPSLSKSAAAKQVLEDWGPKVEISYSLPDSVTKKVNEFAGKLKIKVTSVEIGASRKTRDCCDDNGNVKEDGESETTASVKLGLASSDPIPIPNLGFSIKETIHGPFGLGGAQFKAAGGLILKAAIDIVGEAGARSSDCYPEDNCGFASLGIDVPISLEVTFESFICNVEGEDCDGFDIDFVKASSGIEAKFGYNVRDCQSGFDVTAAIKGITVSSGVKIFGTTYGVSKSFPGLTLF